MIKKSSKKITKKSTIKKKRIIKKAPPIIKEVIVEKSTKPIAEILEQKKVIFYGTIYETKIMEICLENEFPFDYRRAKVDGKIVDFINRTKRLIIEVYNPERSEEEVQARLRAFLVQRFKTKYITKDKFSMRNWRKSFVISINRFLE